MRDPISENRHDVRRRYRTVRLTLVYELEIGMPYRWDDESRAALAELVAAVDRIRSVDRMTAGGHEDLDRRSPVAERGHAAVRPDPAKGSARPRIRLVETRAVGVRPR